MGDEWVCQDCNYGTDDAPRNNECPLCKGSMVNIGEVDDDLKIKDEDNKDYDNDEMDTPMDESLEDDFAENLDEEETAKKSNQ